MNDVKYLIDREEVGINGGDDNSVMVYYNGNDVDTPYRIFCGSREGHTRLKATRNELLDFIDKVKILVEDKDEQKSRTNGDDLVLSRSEVKDMMKGLQRVLNKSAGVVKNGND